MLPPGPKGNWLLGNARALGADPLRMISETVREFGETARFRVAKWWIHLITRPADVQHVLQDRVKNYSKRTTGYGRLSNLLLGDGLVTSEGELWKRQRRIVQPAFHKQRLQLLAASMVRATTEMTGRWTGERLDLAAEMTHLTLRIVGETILGADVSAVVDRCGESFAALNEGLMRRIMAPVNLPLWVPSGANRRFAARVREVDQVVYGMIAERRRAPGESDLISMLLAARDEETGEGMSDRQLRDEVMTMFFAGHETTATALAWTFFLVGKHPEVERRLRAEVSEVLGGREAGFEDLERLRYTRMVIEESMRLYPPVWSTMRNTEADDQIGDWSVPRGTWLLASSYLTHRLPSVWERPDAFEPERFSPERAAARPRFAYFPFLGGPRQCLGNQFSMMEAQLILATVTQRQRLELACETIEMAPLLTLRPVGGVPMIRRAA